MVVCIVVTGSLLRLGGGHESRAGTPLTRVVFGPKNYRKVSMA
jgi:hypothetical protein